MATIWGEGNEGCPEVDKWQKILYNDFVYNEGCLEVDKSWGMSVYEVAALHNTMQPSGTQKHSS